MIWKNAKTDPPPDNTKILVKVSPSIANGYYGPWPGASVMSGMFVTYSKEEFKRLENGLYEKVSVHKRYFDDVEPDREDLEDNTFEWTEFPE